jgi:hypothetical protein
VNSILGFDFTLFARNFGVEVVFDYAKALKVDPDELLRGRAVKTARSKRSPTSIRTCPASAGSSLIPLEAAFVENSVTTASTTVTRGGGFPSQEVFKTTTEQQSATVSRTVVGYQVSGLAQFGWSSGKTRSRE